MLFAVCRAQRKGYADKIFPACYQRILVTEFCSGYLNGGRWALGPTTESRHNLSQCMNNDVCFGWPQECKYNVSCKRESMMRRKISFGCGIVCGGVCFPFETCLNKLTQQWRRFKPIKNTLISETAVTHSQPFAALFRVSHVIFHRVRAEANISLSNFSLGKSH